MNAENLVVDDTREREVVEHVGEVVPHGSVAIFSAAFRVEAIRLRDAAGFVIATDQMDALGIAEFQADEERDGFDGEETAVNIVA